MLTAYLILAHKSPNQLKRLVARLSSENSHIFIHLDNKTVNVLDYFSIANEVKNVYFIANRVIVNWGAYSMVQATLNGLQQIMDTGIPFDYIHLLSGEDYPIKPNSYIQDFFNRNKGAEFLSYSAFPTPDLPGGGMDRIEYYYDFDNPDTSYNSPNYDVYEREMKQKGIKRKFIEGMKPYHGSQWWSLTANCIRYVLKTVGENSEITNFYRYSKFSDEQFFQTIIMNSEFSKKVINNGLRYIDWRNVDIKDIDWVNSPPHPKILTTMDFPLLYKSPALFARKFDEKVDSNILNMIDEKLLK
ncbi:MAG: beta-1,6-N-acetylglucosaminyltransferase [Clostridiales bacterium]|nr:beta-1,6-N-acetylglucosaminyltransferase [Eubacteriales bacterium]MDH7567627.1 beta-1,6-N-acetylglucosaminyltransferase [Clostridiales bacterium]